MFIQDNCPACGSTNLVKNGNTYYGKTRLKCKNCGRQFVEKRTHTPLSNECKRRVELMLAERLSLEAICRVMEIEPHRLYAYMDELYGEIPEDLACSIPDNAAIELVENDCEADELCGAARAVVRWPQVQQEMALAGLGSQQPPSDSPVCWRPKRGRSQRVVGGSARALPRAGYLLHRRLGGLQKSHPGRAASVPKDEEGHRTGGPAIMLRGSSARFGNGARDW